ncbi:MAG: NTP transferase domain-containing protein [Ignavibacteria bacterium]|nr:NTP transferase domain-containing protein [Ignavibacteria bacterium]
MQKAVIMAGGFGTRLRPLTMSIPKPMVPLANRPMMGHIVQLLKKHGITRMVSVLYFQPESITSYFGDGAKMGVQMEYITAEADFGTAGSVKNAESLLQEPFIVISGDVLTDFDITAAINFHKAKGAMATIVLTRVPQPLQYGIVMTDSEDRITRFLEKPSWGEVFSDTINTGIYILEPSVLDLIPPKTDFDFSKDLFPLMLSKGLPLFGYTATGYWKDIGNLQEYQLAHSDVLSGKVKVDLPGEPCDSAVCGSNLDLAPSAHLEGMVVFGDNVKVGKGAFLKDCIVGSNSVIGENAALTDSVLWDHVKIGANVKVTNAVLCNGVRISDGAEIASNVFIAEDCVIGSKARVYKNVKLWPRKVVESEAVVTRSLVQEERWARDLFTDARITGISNIDMNPEFGAKIGSALGMSLGAGTQLVASRDDDATSRIMKRSITSGLMSVGVNVTDLQTTSIPQTRQEMNTGKYVAGFHVRKSPRHKDQTDIILFGKDGRDFALSATKAVERYFYGEDIKRVQYDKVGRLEFPERPIGAYVERFLKSLDVDTIRSSQYKILVDYSFGLASTVFPQILGELKCKVLGMNNYVDVAHYADELSEVLDESASIMRSLGYEIGFKIDPGVEKIALVDERGIWYTSLRLLSIVTKMFLEANTQHEPYAIAVPVHATQEIDLIAADYNVQVVRIKNSHSAMMEATKDENVKFVGGTRGGFIFPEFLRASDGMFSACKIIEMISQTGCQLSELDRTLPKRHQFSVLVDCPWEAKGTVMRRAMEFSEDKERMLVDGVKIFIDSASVLLVPDKEQAVFAVTAEADTAEKALEIKDTYAELVAQWRSGN